MNTLRDHVPHRTPDKNREVANRLPLPRPSRTSLGLSIRAAVACPARLALTFGIVATSACYSYAPPQTPEPVVVELPVRQDVPEPSASNRVQVDFSALFTDDADSASFVVPRGVSLRRTAMMVGPNLVIEASRSSLAEAPIGASNAMMGPPASTSGQSFPTQSNALGGAVSLEASSALLAHLSDHNVRLIAPAFTSIWCDDRDAVLDSDGNRVSRCPQATWLERVLLMGRDFRALSDDDERPYELPEYVMAVRSLGPTTRTRHIVVDPVSDTQFRVRATDTPGETCPDVRVDVLAVEFVAEILRTDTGEVVARIDERRPVRLSSEQANELNVSVQFFDRVAERSQAYARTVDGQNRDPYTYISGWNEDYSHFCSRLAVAFANARDDALSDTTSSTIRSIIDEVMSPLLR